LLGATNGLTEHEFRTVASDLIEVFADLQRKRIAHRNIKPANIVMMEPSQKKPMRVCNFELAVELPSTDDFIEL
jgi:serine/threonine protein kinase